MFWRKRNGIIVNMGTARQVFINSEKFSCRMSDVDVLERLAWLQAEIGKVQAEDAEAVARVVRKVVGLIDEMLGSGASEKLFVGRTVNLHDAVGVMGEIAVQVIAMGGARDGK